MKTRGLQIDGVVIQADYIGQGLFCKAYRNGATVYLLCKGDYSKECLSLFCDLDLPHMPQIVRHEDIAEYQVFSMPYYNPLTKKEYPKAFALWRTLPSKFVGYDAALAYVENCDNPQTLREAIQNLIDNFANYAQPESMLLEFNKVNVSVDNAGNLILRDCLASIDSIKQRREHKRC
jgi:hypothetical protein